MYSSRRDWPRIRGWVECRMIPAVSTTVTAPIAGTPARAVTRLVSQSSAVADGPPIRRPWSASCRSAASAAARLSRR